MAESAVPFAPGVRKFAAAQTDSNGEVLSERFVGTPDDLVAAGILCTEHLLDDHEVSRAFPLDGAIRFVRRFGRGLLAVTRAARPPSEPAPDLSRRWPFPVHIGSFPS